MPVSIYLAVWFLTLLLPGGQPAYRSEFIFEKAPFRECHASTIVETANGDFLAAWFGGTREGTGDVAIWMSRLSAGRWSPPEVVARAPDVPTWNPVLFRAPRGRLWIYYKVGPSPESWTGARKFSDDDGKTWQGPEYLPAGLLGPIKDKPIVLANGDIVAGSSTESYHSWSAWIERSTDGGNSWVRFGPIVIPGEPYGIIQPTLVELAPNRLRLFARSRQGKIYFADSSDAGRTWSPARPTPLPNPNSGIDAVRLRDGPILMVYNPSTRERTPLAVAVSRDGGDTWTKWLDLETGPGEFSYPAVIEDSRGDVHITYTWNRRRIKHVVILKGTSLLRGGS
jgi:predicted neuraminidase